MRISGRALLAVLALVAACHEDPGPEDCAEPQTSRCNGNQLQLCISGGCWGGTCVAPHWLTLETCVAPKVCHIGTNAEIDRWVRDGCFDPGSSCGPEGEATCAMAGLALPVDLWTCVRDPSCSSLQWTLTRCDEQKPGGVCLSEGTWSDGPPPAACYETTGTCPPSSLYDSRCTGTLLQQCARSGIVNGVLSLDWTTVYDCAADGQVCKTVAGNGAMCAPP
jgi:hypothetical protein